MGILKISLIVGTLLSIAVQAERPIPTPAPAEELDKPIFKASVGGDLKAHWESGPEKAAELNALISAPCFEFTQAYCMPTTNTEVGFVCSGQSAVVVTHLRSLGIAAAPLYLEWEDPLGKVQAHAMVVVPFEKDGKSCHHILETARTYPNQPVVELTHCEPKTTKDVSEALRKVVQEHFVNPPVHDAKRQAANLPARRPIPKDSPFTARIKKESFDVKDVYNSDAPIWTLEKGRLACPEGLCKVHKVGVHMFVDQTKVVSGDPRTFNKTEIIADYSKSQQYTCARYCRREDCTLKGGTYPSDGVRLEWPPMRATCPQAAILRSHMINAAVSCKSLCETTRKDYSGGTYKITAPEEPMKCSPLGPVLHRVHKPVPKDAPPDGSDVKNRTIPNHK